MFKSSAGKYKGNSLIEILLYVGLTATILVSITLAYTQTLSIRAENRVKRELDSQATFVIDQIEREVLSAQNVVQPAENTSGSTLELVIPSQPGNSIFTLTSGNIRLTKNSVNSDLTSDVQINSLAFTNRRVGSTPQTIDYSFTLSRSSEGRSYEVSYSGTVSVRR